MENPDLTFVTAVKAPANDLSAIAIEVSRRMKERGMNAKELARRAGLGHTYIYDIMAGRSGSPTLDKLRKIAVALDCRLEDLTSPLTNSQSRDPQSGNRVDITGVLPLRPSEYALIKLWRILPPRDREKALAVMRKAAFILIDELAPIPGADIVTDDDIVTDE